MPMGLAQHLAEFEEKRPRGASMEAKCATLRAATAACFYHERVLQTLLHAPCEPKLVL